MGVSAEKLDWCIPLDTTDCFVDCIEFRSSNMDMSNNQEEVHLPISNCFLKPCLFDYLLDWLNDRIVVVSSKVEDKSKSKNLQALLLGCKLLVPGCKWNQIACPRVYDIQIRRQIIVLECRDRDKVLIL